MPSAAAFISSWYCIPESELEEATLAGFAAAGYTVFQTLDLTPGGGWRPYSRAGNLRALDLCAELGLGCIVVDARLYRDARPLGASERPDVAAVDAVIEDYTSHSALLGYLVYDEPSPHAFPILAPVFARLRARDPRRVLLAPLFPMHDDPRFPDSFEGLSYPRYLDEFVAACDPTVLAYDYYPFFEPRTRMPDYVRNFGIARDVARRRRLPLWYYAGIVSPPGALPATAGRIRLQVNLAVAYGARAILHYTYRSPSAGEGGPIDVDGRVDAAAWEVARAVNRETAALLRTTAGWVSHGVYHGEPLPPGGDAAPAHVQIPDETALALLGPAERAVAAVIVNRDVERPRRIDGRVGDRAFALTLPPGGAGLTII